MKNSKKQELFDQNVKFMNGQLENIQKFGFGSVPKLNDKEAIKNSFNSAFKEAEQFAGNSEENKTVLGIVKLKYLLYFGIFVAIVFCCIKF